jgi:DNA replication licensing factor MCM6
LIDRSTFINWQKIHVQENANEIPPGSMPRGVEVIVRNDQVERAKPGDKMTFIGSVMAIPDVGQLALPGGRVENTRDGGRPKDGYDNGVGGLKALGVRELTYKLSFVSCMVTAEDAKVRRSRRRIFGLFR